MLKDADDYTRMPVRKQKPDEHEVITEEATNWRGEDLIRLKNNGPSDSGITSNRFMRYG
ncbi:hypothetical protein [uncultured Ruegeria sp.]|uniref:hypothetical protein n=1 Tax=uncultured Ruegeria sp. TaxID=259304 RepID=UPI002618031F|nr:hypothetical protein [uncultured Ruegeria sp.]